MEWSRAQNGTSSETPSEIEEIVGKTDNVVTEMMTSAHVETPIGRFRLQCRNLFLTYPRNDLAPEILSERIQEALDPEWSVVCQEQHDDEGLHLHALIRLKSKGTWSKFDMFDALGGKHGNYQAARSIRALMKYVTKEGGRIIPVGVDPKYFLRMAKKRKRCVDTKGTQVSEIIRNGGSFKNIVEKFPGFALMNMHKIRSFQTWCENEKYKKGT